MCACEFAKIDSPIHFYLDFTLITLSFVPVTKQFDLNATYVSDSNNFSLAINSLIFGIIYGIVLILTSVILYVALTNKQFLSIPLISTIPYSWMSRFFRNLLLVFSITSFCFYFFMWKASHSTNEIKLAHYLLSVTRLALALRDVIRYPNLQKYNTFDIVLLGYWFPPPDFFFSFCSRRVSK